MRMLINDTRHLPMLCNMLQASEDLESENDDKPARQRGSRGASSSQPRSKRQRMQQEASEEQDEEDEEVRTCLPTDPSPGR